MKITEKEIAPFINKAKSLTISGPKDMEKSAEILSQLNRQLDALTEDKELLTKPINESLKQIRAKYKPLETLLDSAIRAIRSEQSRYQTEQIKLARKEEEKLAAKVSSGYIKPETAISKMEDIKTPEAKITTDSGSLKFREDKILKITNHLLIPREYLVINEKALLDALKTGQVIPGAELDIKLVPINNRR